MPTNRPPRLRSFTLSIYTLLLLVSLPHAAAAQPAGYVFVAGNYYFSFIDTVTQTVSAPVNLQVNNEAVASRDGRRVYVTQGSHMRTIDVATNQLVATAPTNSPLAIQTSGIALTPDESTAWIANVGANNVGVIDLSTNTLITTVPVGFTTLDVAITPDGQRALVVGGASELKVIDVANRTVTGSIPLAGNGYSVSVHPGGHFAYVALRSADAISVVNLDTNSQVTTIHLGAAPNDVAFSPDGSAAYVAVQQPAGLRRIATASHTVNGTLNGGAQPVLGYSVTITPDGSKIYAGGLNEHNRVTLVDAASFSFVSDIDTGPYPFGLAAGPHIIRGDCCGATAIANDAGLTALHMGNYVPFFHGTLTLTGNWTTTRTISLLSDGATKTDGVIDTTWNEATINGRVIGEGTLVKRGIGLLTLMGDSTHTGGTRVENGQLDVNGLHTGTVTVAPYAILGGAGTIGAIQAASAARVVVSGSMTANQITLAPGAQLDLALLSATPTNQPLVNVTGTANVEDSILTLWFGMGCSMARGTARTLVTNATGHFRDKPEGWTMPFGDLLFRLTYRGGSSGSDIMLLSEGGPTLAAIGNQTIVQDAALGPITLGVADDFTAPGGLTITATSSNQALVPNGSISIGNTAGTRTLTATPLFGQSGQTTITVTVRDEASLQAQQTFVLTVVPTRSYYLAEGATGGFFSTDILLANPNATAAPIDIKFSKDDGTTIVRQMTLPATSRTTLRANEVEGLEASAFSTTVVSTSGMPLVVERTMWWDATGYGASTEKAGTEGATTWYFAEGAQGYFHTFFLLFNPNITATVAHVTYLMEDGAAIQRDYQVAAGTRVTVDAGDVPELTDRSFGARIVFDHPALAERAMYFGETPLWVGGAAAAGVTAPAASWYLAEGATGSFFDTFVLIANPNDAPANLTLTYLPDTGQPIEKTRRLEAHQRVTLNLADQDVALVNAAVSTRVESDQPVVVERSQYWPHGNWYESHASAGQTATALNWGLAEGRVGGASEARTFILIANPGASVAEITATFLRADGTAIVKEFSVQPTSRFTIAVSGEADGQVPELTNESFATIIASTAPVIVERSLYTNGNGVMWTAGTNSTGTRLDP